MSFKKYFLLFILFGVFVLALLYPKTGLTKTVIYGGCSGYIGQIYYNTKCPGEGDVTVGECYWRDCECCCPDGEGGCESYDCCSQCRRCSCSGRWNEYQCAPADCGGNIYIKRCEAERKGSCSSGDCGTGQQCCVECQSPELCQECESWQKPLRDDCDDPNCTDWCLGIPKCTCCGECIEQPTGLSYSQTPFGPVKLIDSSDDLRLPIRLIWNDVPGWRPGDGSYTAQTKAQQEVSKCWKDNRKACWDWANNEYPQYNGCCGWLNKHVNECLSVICPTWKELVEEKCKDVGKCPALDLEGDPEKADCLDLGDFVQSYRILIKGELNNCNDLYNMSDKEAYEDNYEIGAYTAVITDKSEFLPPCPCFFKPGREEYIWRVQACCTPEGENCGPWSDEEKFFTSRAPEPIWPADPDWMGLAGRENTSYEDSRELEWCIPEDSDYYHDSWGYFVPLSYTILIYYLDESGNYVCHPLLLTEEGKCVPEYLGPGDALPPNNFYIDNFVTRNTSYLWQIAACKDNLGYDCGPYSQEWKFSTTTWQIGISRSAPDNNYEKPTGIPVRIAWASFFARSFKYKIYEGKVESCNKASPIFEGTTIENEKTLHYHEKINPLSILKLDTVYTWCVQPCRDVYTQDCDDYWGGPWYFRTTGRPPKSDTMKPDNEGILIPTEFSWEKVPGAESYRLWVDNVGLTEDIIVDKRAQFFMDYPEYNILPEKTYNWLVKTCAEVGGKLCGEESEIKTFATFEWEEISDPKPEDNLEVYRTNISWGRVTGAKYYQYTVKFIEVDPDEPRQEECEAKAEAETVTDQKIVSARDRSVSLGLGMKCWGRYEWRVMPCLDVNCESAGDESIWHFYFKAPFLPPDESPGLIPCNQPYNNPDTNWNETDPCGIKHLFILVHVIVDFLVIKVVPMILVLLVLASGVIIYLSRKMETPNPMAKVKSLWKAAGIGIILLLFAWTITSLFFSLFGYALGPWHIFEQIRL